MTDKPRIGGYVFQQTLARGKGAIASARVALRRIVEEQPGPAAAAVLQTKIALALGEAGAAFEELEDLGRMAKTGQLPPVED